jgi:hypothetical protein
MIGRDLFPDLAPGLIESPQGFLMLGSESPVLDAAGRLSHFDCFNRSSLVNDIECLTRGTSATFLGLPRTMRYLPTSLVIVDSHAAKTHGLDSELLTRGLPAVQLGTLIIIIDYPSTAAPPAALPWLGIVRRQLSIAEAAAAVPLPGDWPLTGIVLSSFVPVLRHMPEAEVVLV